jgi:hypothetical protein
MTIARTHTFPPQETRNPCLQFHCHSATVDRVYLVASRFSHSQRFRTASRINCAPALSELSAGVRLSMGHNYIAGCDASGGRNDSFTAAISHRERDGKIVLDVLYERRSPFNPSEVVDCVNIAAGKSLATSTLSIG